jgi:FkbM family methyltransferase
MSLSNRARKAWLLLKEQGPHALFRALSGFVRKRLYRIPQVSETDLAHQVLSRHFPSGVMVDVGAHHGSALHPFAADGWQVIAFEPDDRNRSILQQHHGGNPRISIDPRGLSDEVREGVAFFTSNISTGISGLSAFHQSHKESQRIDITTLRIALQQKNVDRVDFLKIDTEGFDFAVLRGYDWEASHPEMIVCEFEDRKTIPLGYTFHDLAHYLKGKGYQILVSEWFPIVEYGTSHRWRRFQTYPCELAEPAAWGNLIAARQNEVFGELTQQAETLSRQMGSR